MSSLELEAYEILKSRFSDKEAAKVIEYFESKAEEKINQRKDIFLTKDDKIDLVSKIESAKSDTIKWMFIFWIGQLAATAGIIFAFLSVYFRK